MDPELIADRVRTFYGELPFNYYGDLDHGVAALRAANPIPASYPDLHAVLISGRVRSAIDAGCGAGWLTNTLALHYGITVTGVDFTARAIRRGQEVAARLGLSGVHYCLADLMEFVPTQPVDLVLGLGVLHHTASAAATFEKIQAWVACGGSIHLGLYHRWGRKPFLEHYRRILREGGEAEALATYRRADPARAQDELHLRSWFRDQVLHPHETHHSLLEVEGWLRAAGFALVSSSLNHFAAVEDWSEVFAAEPCWEAYSARVNGQEGRFFPGFFTALARRRSPHLEGGRGAH